MGPMVSLVPAFPVSSLSPTRSRDQPCSAVYHSCGLVGCEDWGFHSLEKDSQVSPGLPWARGTVSRIVLEPRPCDPSLAL